MKTVNVGSIFDIQHYGTFEWTGENLISTNFSSISPVNNIESKYIKLVPSDLSIVAITDNSQVTSKTKFSD